MSLIDSVYLPEMTPKNVETLNTMVVCEDIHIEDYDMRRHYLTMEREDCVVSLFPFLLC